MLPRGSRRTSCTRCSGKGGGPVGYVHRMQSPNKQSSTQGPPLEALNVLKNLTLDYWYKMLIPLALGLFVLAITVDLRVISNGSLVLLAIGLFMIGLGEWINHPRQEAINLHLNMKITLHRWKPKAWGIALDLAGAVLGGIGFFGIVRAAIRAAA
ncbi:hypothetical protein C6Q28_10660 [Burkholderia multivorans]|uniref:Bacteriophage protein n=2 Tax=Burkholderia multivorans TaxID=87883 RepID=A0A0H3KMQ0_BURM1|nr:gp33 [Burkholderia phage Bcep176]ABA60034.1 gp33 [Burkholderia phage Bcep176]PRF62430.1 hypothetical protein C6Q28_10660 [Burkholderia multivorans]BAG46521.1 bacteriophage protein [Burkholderia multivorans ATCC 17616]